jgi:hypothetical protein
VIPGEYCKLIQSSDEIPAGSDVSSDEYADGKCGEGVHAEEQLERLRLGVGNVTNRRGRVDLVGALLQVMVTRLVVHCYSGTRGVSKTMGKQGVGAEEVEFGHCLQSIWGPDHSLSGRESACFTLATHSCSRCG